jgi:hypothetical protein
MISALQFADVKQHNVICDSQLPGINTDGLDIGPRTVSAPCTFTSAASIMFRLSTPVLVAILCLTAASPAVSLSTYTANWLRKY